ncbi:MAG: tetratricopeptide repeat protein [Rhodocyclaceae bacterium]
MPLEIRPDKSVRWAIHYPQIVSIPPAVLDAMPAAEREDARLAQSEGLTGNYQMAAAALEPAGAVSPTVRAYRANMLLAIGRFDEARDIISVLDPQKDANAASLMAIISVARNQAAEAVEYAGRAVSLDAKSPTAHLALSYAWQSQRDLARALAEARLATELDASDALAWVRRAEVEVAMSELDEAQASLDRAIALEPELPRAHALRGFVALAKGDADSALTLFNAAIERNSAEPLAWYGRAMARTRLGQSDDGRRDLEVAVTLDPSNAELRAYLARSYAEADRMDEAVAQNDLARKLDPLSPTPWYFEALRRQDANDPVGAIQAAEEAQRRNGNRAVLRPASLIGQDSATREANMSKSYEMMGWYAAMQRAAADAVTRDPQSGATHHFLASALANGGQSEFARMSELLQAQLRQRPGQWPLPPQYYVPGLPILDGPRALSTEETSDLFERQPNHFWVSAIGGNNGTVGGSLLASHAWQTGQISAGYFDYRTDGWRAGSDFRTRAAQIDVQQQLTSKLTVYGQIRQQERSSGDLIQALAVNAPGSSQLHRDTTYNVGQMGFRYDASPSEQWLGNFSFTHAPYYSVQLQPLLGKTYQYTVDASINARLAELQYLRAWEVQSVQAGAGTYNRASLANRLSGFVSVPPGPMTASSSGGGERHDNAYAVWQGRYGGGWTLFAGVSYDQIEGSDNLRLGRWSPKLGAEFATQSGLTLRAAGYRSMAPSLTLQQSLRPATFNGFTDAPDDLFGTVSTRYAIAADQRIGATGKTGVELSTRSVHVPSAGCPGASCTASWPERAHRAYASWAPLTWLALTAEWRYDSFHRPISFDQTRTSSVSTPMRIRTQQIPLRAWIRMGPQFSSTVEVRQVRQDVTGWTTYANSLWSENFWLTNVSVRQSIDGDRYWWEFAINNLFDRDFRFQDSSMSGSLHPPRILAWSQLFAARQCQMVVVPFRIT